MITKEITCFFIKERGYRMKITYLSKTRLGKRSVNLTIVGIVLFIIGSVLPWEPGYSGLEFVVQNPLQTIITLLILALSAAAFILGLTATVKQKERSVLVFLAILLGLYNMFGSGVALLSLFL